MQANGNGALGGFPAMKRITDKEASAYKIPSYSIQQEYDRLRDQELGQEEPSSDGVKCVKCGWIMPYKPKSDGLCGRCFRNARETKTDTK
jgi:hypothetical protein